MCGASFQQRLHSHLYNIILLAGTVILYLVYQEVRLTFIEAKYIGVTSLLCGPIMVSWVVAGLTVQTDQQDLATILGLLVTTTVTATVIAAFLSPMPTYLLLSMDEIMRRFLGQK